MMLIHTNADTSDLHTNADTSDLYDFILYPLKLDSAVLNI